MEAAARTLSNHFLSNLDSHPVDRVWDLRRKLKMIVAQMDTVSSHPPGGGFCRTGSGVVLRLIRITSNSRLPNNFVSTKIEFLTQS